ncbi:molybdenum-binding protein [Halobacteriales archaeon QS_9_67_17]|nr:MAG: molybdenum-binding protein [Halobacteriales archaeon QS_9_67_17]
MGIDVRTEFDAYIGSGDVTVDARDVTLLRAIDSEGSLNAATDSLGRSYGHAQQRIVELEAAFGSLVDRQRGGADGGGSELTETADELLAAFDRVQTSFEGVAEVAETVLPGALVERDGELATVETPAGRLRALVPSAGDGTVQLTIPADAVTLHEATTAPVPDTTSARNQFAGTVRDIEGGERIARVAVDIGADDPVLALVTEDSRERLALEVGREVTVSFKATATRGVFD